MTIISKYILYDKDFLLETEPRIGDISKQNILDSKKKNFDREIYISKLENNRGNINLDNEPPISDITIIKHVNKFIVSNVSPSGATRGYSSIVPSYANGVLTGVTASVPAVNFSNVISCVNVKV